MPLTTTPALPDHAALLADATHAVGGTGRADRVLVVIPTRNRPDRIHRQLRSLPPEYDILLLGTEPHDLPADLPTDPRVSHRTGPFPDTGFSFGTPHPDLSAKRNVGLQQARSGSYDAAVFMDDDVEVTAPDVRAMVAALDEYSVVSRRSVGLADHSMLYRVLGRAGLVAPFVSGSCLAARPGYQGVFPNIYNEDWFFMWPALCRRDVGQLADVCQVEVGFAAGDQTQRAAAEEVGDVLAEGFFRGLHELAPDTWPQESGRTLQAEGFWSRMLRRREFLYELAHTILARYPAVDGELLLHQLRAGQDVLTGLSARELAAAAAELWATSAGALPSGAPQQTPTGVGSGRVSL